ncbi:MAG: hypothetical protein ACE5OZ_24135 [Candidatus Heimdallarchaeota archaeon]
MKISGKQTFQLNGPFYTGFFIDSSTLIEEGYSKAQRRILTALEKNKAQGWAIEGLRGRDDLLFGAEFAKKSVYAGTLMTAPSLIIHKLPILDKEIDFQGYQFVIKSVISYYHDYGVGIYNLDVELTLTEEIQLSEYRTIVEQFSATLTSILNPYIAEDTSTFKHILESLSIPIEDYEAVCELLEARGSNFIPLQQCLWFHRIFTFTVETEITDELINEFLVLLSSSQPEGPKNCSLSPNAAVFPGYGNSLLIVNQKLDKQINLDRLIAVAQFYYATTSLLDTILFMRFADFFAKKDADLRIQEIEKDVHEVKRLGDQLELFLLLLKDSRLNFSPDSTQMWSVLEAEWYYTPLLAALQEKTELLQNKSKELLDDLNQKRQATLNKLVKVFTVLAVLGPLLEVYVFLSDNEVVVTDSIDFFLLNLGLILLVSIPISTALLAGGYYLAKKYLMKYF